MKLRSKNLPHTMPTKASKSGKKKEAAPTVEYTAVSERQADLWTCHKTHSIAHCVAEDLRMGAGIAVGFKQNFKGVDDLCAQKKRVGHVAILRDEERFIYYLVTKKVSNGKPYYEDLDRCLTEMRDHCVANGVVQLAMPRIGCGLDRLDWHHRVKPMLEKTFAGTGVAVEVYNFQQGHGKHEPKATTSSAESSPDKKEKKKSKNK